MSSREPVYWYGNIIDLSVESKLQQDPEKFKNQNLEIAGANLIGIRRQEERHQETLLDEIIGTFNTKLQKRSELNKPEQTDSEDSPVEKQVTKESLDKDEEIIRIILSRRLGSFMA